MLRPNYSPQSHRQQIPWPQPSYQFFLDTVVCEQEDPRLVSNLEREHNDWSFRASSHITTPDRKIILPLECGIKFYALSRRSRPTCHSTLRVHYHPKISLCLMRSRDLIVDILRLN